MAISSLYTRMRKGSGFYHRKHFLDDVEAHMSHIRAHPETHVHLVKPRVAHKYHGDLFGLLSHWDISPKLFWVTMRLNGMSSPMDYSEEITELMIPDISIIVDLHRRHRSLYFSH